MNTKTSAKDLEYYIGKLQPEFESKDQAEIGRMLDEYGIPFFYKEPVLICQDGQRKILRPDFSLPTYNNLMIEYNPETDHVPNASRDMYRHNNIAALILGSSDLDGPDWQQRLYDRMEEIYHRPIAYRTGSNF